MFASLSDSVTHMMSSATITMGNDAVPSMRKQGMESTMKATHAVSSIRRRPTLSDSVPEPKMMSRYAMSAMSVASCAWDASIEV